MEKTTMKESIKIKTNPYGSAVKDDIIHGFDIKTIIRGAVLMMALGTMAVACVFAGCSNGSAGTTVPQSNEGSSVTESYGSSTGESTNPSTQPGVDSEGWAVENSFMPLLTSEEQGIFEEAIADLTDASYEPVFVIGEQVVSGMNRAFLCHRKVAGTNEDQSWVVVVVYQDLRGKSEIIAINEFDPTDIYVVDPRIEEYTLVGGWSCPTDDIDPQALSDEAYDVFRKATTNTDSSMYFEPILLLATQRAPEVYYRLLCRGTYYGSEPPTSNMYVVDLYKDANGKASIYSYKRVDVSAYVTSS